MTRQMPAGACDCHFHVFDDRYPMVPNAVFRPGPAPLDAYRAFAEGLGLSRAVVVNPSSYGTDNRCTLAALAELGSHGRAVAVVDYTVADAELERMDSLGVRGIRFNLVHAGATRLEMLAPLAHRVAGLGWHLQLNMQGAEIAEHEALLSSLPVPLVFDHGGRIPLPEGQRHKGWAALRRLIDAGRSWVKLSAPYQNSRIGPPHYDDMVTLGRDFVEVARDRILWGSDWPHITETETPNGKNLMDYLFHCVDSDGDLKQVLRDNPAQVYGFT